MKSLVLVSLISLVGCTKSGPPTSSEPPVALTQEQLAKKGQAVYQTVCIACHNADPSKDGAVGPAIAGSSLALVEGRILRNEYPPGYTPKRATHVMPQFPQLKDDIPAIAAFLK